MQKGARITVQRPERHAICSRRADLGLLRGGTQRLTAGWCSAPHHTDDDGERPRPVGQAGQIPAADVPLDLRAQLGGQCLESGKHPVEIGHDEIEVRFAPISRRLGVDPDVHPGVYFPAYSGNSAPAVCLLGKILLDRSRGSGCNVSGWTISSVRLATSA